jgi:hypothetical protein
MYICPHGGHAIEITPPLGVNQPAPLPFDNNYLLVPLPVLHLGKWVPNMTLIPLAQLLGCYCSRFSHPYFLGINQLGIGHKKNPPEPVRWVSFLHDYG